MEVLGHLRGDQSSERRSLANSDGRAADDSDRFGVEVRSAANGAGWTDDVLPDMEPCSMANDNDDMDGGDTPDLTIKSDGEEFEVDIQSELTKQRQSGETNKRDYYCWVCHKDKCNIVCQLCPRSFHMRCLTASGAGENGSKSLEKLDSGWACEVCESVMTAEEGKTRAPTLAQLSPDDLSVLLKFALHTIKMSSDVSFHNPVDVTEFHDYMNYIANPMDFKRIEDNVKTNMYGCTEAFLADVKWILHNCIIYNDQGHKLTKNAYYFFKVAKNEMMELEICPTCFRNFYQLGEGSWFTEPCTKPHMLVWAKLTGYPYWPAKAVRVNAKKKEVDVRFFGGHEKAWVPFDACLQLSESYPSGKSRGMKQKLDKALSELELHLKRLNLRFPNKFKYAAAKTSFSPSNLYMCDGNSEAEESSDDKAVKEENQETGDNYVKGDTVKTEEENSASKPKPGVFSLSNDNALEAFQRDMKKPSTVAACIKTLCTKDEPVVKKTAKTKVTPTRPAAGTNKDSASSTSGGKSVEPAPAAQKRPSTSLLMSLSSSPTKKTVTSPSNAKKAKTVATLPKDLTQVPLKGTPQKVTPKAKSNRSSTATMDDIKNVEGELSDMRNQISFDRLMHQEEIREVKHNAKLIEAEMRSSWVAEKKRALEEQRVRLEIEFNKQIDAIKRKQWCAACLKEAVYFCCWNTSYCSYACQSKHWPKHMAACQQQQHKNQRNQSSSPSSSSSHQPSAGPSVEPQSLHYMSL